MRKHHLSSLFLAPLFLLACNAFADTKTDTWGDKLLEYIRLVGKEYTYYANVYDDGSYFPKARTREILHHIEVHFLQPHRDEIMNVNENDKRVLYGSHNIDMAKLFMHYGAIAFAPSKSRNVQPITGVARQYPRGKDINKNLSHDEIIAIIKDPLANKDPVSGDLPSNNSIALIKLYLSLGANIFDQETRKTNGALYASLYDYSFIREDGVPIDEKHKIGWVGKYLGTEIENHHYGDGDFYRSPVTYWIEDFIAREYPIAMLDSHALLYSRFMETASVEDIADILTNPEAHKIPINTNCPYIKAYKDGSIDEIEVKFICALTPSIDMRDAMGRTPLHIAKVTGNDAVYDYLIAQGANTTIRDFRGNLAASMTKTYFKSYEHRRIAAVEQFFEVIADVPFS
ncbi:MAG: hypothetical protein K0U45_01115, partial [Alphaproteobacteria bacterium]|nr:hypothetical protein [Alphaproteobacteria bacterium]